MKNSAWKIGDLIKYHRFNRKYGQADSCLGVVTRVNPYKTNQYRVHWFDDDNETSEFPYTGENTDEENCITNVSFLIREGKYGSQT